MRSIIFTLALMASFFVARTQAYKFIYYMDDNLNFVQKENATVTAKAYEENGRIVADCFARSTGKKLISATFTDSLLSELNGPFRTYYPNASLESEGSYSNNEMDGAWRYWNDKGFLTDSVVYRKGLRIAYAKYEYFFDRITLGKYFGPDSLQSGSYLLRHSLIDSLAGTFQEREVRVLNGVTNSVFEALFNSTGGTVSYYDSTGALTKTEKVKDSAMVQAEFPGGLDAWRSYLQKSLNANVPFNNNAPAGKYIVIVKFIVDTDGNLWDIKAESNPGYGTAEEAVRVIRHAPKWKPAFRYGRPYIAYRRQPVTFIVE